MALTFFTSYFYVEIRNMKTKNIEKLTGHIDSLQCFTECLNQIFSIGRALEWCLCGWMYGLYVCCLVWTVEVLLLIDEKTDCHFYKFMICSLEFYICLSICRRKIVFFSVLYCVYALTFSVAIFLLVFQINVQILKIWARKFTKEYSHWKNAVFFLFMSLFWIILVFIFFQINLTRF